LPSGKFNHFKTNWWRPQGSSGKQKAELGVPIFTARKEGDNPIPAQQLANEVWVA
jgi:hypothetical protein